MIFSMKKIFLFLLSLGLIISCSPESVPEENNPDTDTVVSPIDTTIVVPVIPPETTEVIVPDTTIFPSDDSYRLVSLHSERTRVQPMTGLVFWPDQARSKDATYNKSISLEYSYCLPCKVVTGKEDGKIIYDWTWLENILDGISSRGHQAILRFRYEYPNSKDVDGNRGTTAVPDYIKAMDDYSETYSKDAGGDGPTYYADWSNAELQWFTKQFYTDFAAKYGNDKRVAFLEVGFGHWAEYHIYGTKLDLGKNFPSKAYQKEFLQHVATVMPLPWAVSIDAADDYYTPIVDDADLMALNFGLFDDSFMHAGHEIGSSDGYNEENWNAIGKKVRWKTGVCGGEISYYTSGDQRNFLNPEGMYGHTWEEQAAKYHISFMLANDAPSGKYGTAERFLEAGMASGYCFKVWAAETSDRETHLLITNTGVAPIYKDAYFAIGDTRSATSLKGLLPNEAVTITIASPLQNTSDLHIVCDYILDSQKIEYEANIK